MFIFYVSNWFAVINKPSTVLRNKLGLIFQLKYDWIIEKIV